MKSICLFRHGETEWNVEGKRQGHHDSPLTERGRNQALGNAYRLRKNRDISKDVAVFASTLGRAKHTAIILVEALGLPPDAIVFDDRLKESSFGLWEGLTDSEIALQFPDNWQARNKDRWNVRPLSGESYADVHARVDDWYASATLSETNLVVCHGLTSRVLRGIYAGLSPQQVFDLPEPHEGYFQLSRGTIAYIE